MKFFFFFFLFGLLIEPADRLGTFLLDVFMPDAVRRMKQLVRSSCVSMP